MPSILKLVNNFINSDKAKLFTLYQVSEGTAKSSGIAYIAQKRFDKRDSFMVSGFSGEEHRKHQGRCIDCGGVLQLYLLDLKKNKRTLQCEKCGLFHSYTKDLLGKWKLSKVTKLSDL